MVDRYRLPHQPDWPDEPGPYVFLLDASSGLERDLLEHWIAEHRPDRDTIVHWASIPPPRRRSHRTALDPRLAARLDADDDPLLIPLRVVWLAPERDGRRRVALRDVLIPGDPRDPDPIRQRWILAAHPDRVRIVLGAPARKHDLVARWRDPHGRGPVDGTTFAEFVALQGWLALERAERALRGNRYKVPKFLKEDLYWSRGFQQGVAHLALEHGEKLERMQRRTWRYLKEMAATHSPYVIDVISGITGWLISRAYRGLDYSAADLRTVYDAATDKPLVFLPSHKSNFDHLVLQYVLYENEYPPNHTAGGINMNFFPIGPFLRRTGIFFIRREFKDNAPYKFVLRQYLTYLLEKRFPLEWYIEGGRSRSGKLREPRLGLLAYVVDAYVQGFVDDIVFVPVSIAYDQISDISSYAAEQRGAAKERESFGWVLRTIRSLRRRNGDIFVRWGDPVSLTERLPQGADLTTDRGRLVVPKLAFEIATRINAVTPITPISLVAAALLSRSPQALTVDEVLGVLEPFLDYVKRRDLPTTVPLALDTPERVRDALDALAANGVVLRHEGPSQVVYAIGPEQHLAAAYYRNTIIHFFVDGAITELALAGMKAEGTAGWNAFYAEAFALRDVLKFEFFFEERDEFEQALRDELRLHCSESVELLESGDLERLLRSFVPIKSPTVLRPFIEAYLVVADVIADSDPSLPLDPGTVRSRALALGEQYLLQGVIHNGEAISTELFSSATKLAQNRDLLDPIPDRPGRRRAFAVELRRYLELMDDLADLADHGAPAVAGD